MCLLIKTGVVQPLWCLGCKSAQHKNMYSMYVIHVCNYVCMNVLHFKIRTMGIGSGVERLGQS